MKNLPVVASIITGSTETQLNAFLQSMGMAKISESHYYNFQRHYLKKHIEEKADKEIALLHANAKADEKELVLEFDARHASARRSLQTTSSWIDMETGKVMFTVTEEHQDNFDSAKSEMRSFQCGMEYMLQSSMLNITEIVHDDCQQLSNWLKQTVSLYLSNC